MLHHISVPPYGQISFHCIDIWPCIQQLCVLSVLSPFSDIINNALLNIYIQVSAWTCLHFFWLHTWEWNWYYSYSTENHKQFHCPTKNGIMQIMIRYLLQIYLKVHPKGIESVKQICIWWIGRITWFVLLNITLAVRLFHLLMRRGGEISLYII